MQLLWVSLLLPPLIKRLVIFLRYTIHCYNVCEALCVVGFILALPSLLLIKGYYSWEMLSQVNPWASQRLMLALTVHTYGLTTALFITVNHIKLIFTCKELSGVQNQACVQPELHPGQQRGHEARPNDLHWAIQIDCKLTAPVLKRWPVLRKSNIYTTHLFDENIFAEHVIHYYRTKAWVAVNSFHMPI